MKCIPKRSCLAICLCSLLFVQLLAGPKALIGSRQTVRAQEVQATTQRLPGLKERVTVRRDERGIPYIEAANEADLFYMQGYITASDRLFQMDLLRRTARGELSEIFGKATLEEDKRHRALGFARQSEAQVELLSPRLRQGLEAYARGVNAYIEGRDLKGLGPEFQILQVPPRQWKPADSLVIAKLFDEALTSTWYLDITRSAFADLPKPRFDMLFPETSPFDVLLVGTDKASDDRRRAAAGSENERVQPAGPVSPETIRAAAADRLLLQSSLSRLGLYATENAASNNWVVSPRHTTTGRPLLANDPHLQPSAPSIWHMVHLSMPGLRAAGVAATGLPGIAIGHNEQIAWGVTSLEADVQDIYLEKFDEVNPRRYLTPAGWREAEVRREEIKVRKGFMETTTETVPFEVTVTRHGPIIMEREGKRYALQWTAMAPGANLAESFYALATVRNWDEFRAAFKGYSGPPFNMIYADTRGHIGYYGVGIFPIRETGDGKLVYRGETDEGEWKGAIPFESLPHVYDPSSGLIVTANSRIVGRSYPYKLTVAPLAAYRARRIYELLQSKPRLSAEDFRSIQADTYTISGATFAREFVKELSPTTRSPADDRLTERLQLLQQWDGKVVPESRAALLVAHLRDNFRKRILAAALGPERSKQYNYSNADTFIDRLITERPKEWLPSEFKTYAELLRAVYTDATAELTKSYGADDKLWIWGREAQARFPHPLAQVPLFGQQFVIQPFPQNGSTTSLPTVNRGSSVSMRLIADPSDWDSTRQGIALGVSGNPSSPHWKDQLDDWRNVTPRPFPFSQRAVIAAAREAVVYEPATR